MIYNDFSYQGILNEIGDYEELFKTISRLFQNLIQDLSRDEVERMMNTLKGEKGIYFLFLLFVSKQ